MGIRRQAGSLSYIAPSRHHGGYVDGAIECAFRAFQPNQVFRYLIPRPSTSLEIVYHYLCPQGLTFGYKFQMLRMNLIVVLCLLRLKLDVQSYLVTLIDDLARAARHLACVKAHDTRNRSEVFLCASDHFIGSLRLSRIGPKNYNMGKHGSFMGLLLVGATP